MNLVLIIKYLKEISSLFLEMSPFLILGFLVSGILYIIVSKEMIANSLGKPGLISIIKAAIFGVPMPLCSCGVIPVASSLYKRGASKGATLSFLISTPQTGVDSILITYGMLGPLFAITRPFIALITGVAGGMIAENITKDYPSKVKTNHKHPKKTLKDGFKYAFITLPEDIAWPLFKGVLMAGLITLLIPNNFFQYYGVTGISAMMLMALISIPIYVCATASVPIAAGLILSGNLEPGAAFVFLMAGPATNIATITVISKTLGRKIVYTYIGTIFLCSIFFGMLINKFIIINPKIMAHQMEHTNWINIFSGLILFLICIYAVISKYFFNNLTKHNSKNKADLSLIAKGMTCNHCKETVSDAIQTCSDIQDFTIILESGQIFIYGNNLNKKQIIKSINDVGFSVGEN